MERQHKDWTTTVREVQNRREPVHLPDNLRKYFSKNISFPDIYYRGKPDDSSQQGSSYRTGVRARGMASHQNALGHVSRNNPHPYRIVFPFQNGDRLCSYMIWQPMERTSELPSIPPPPRTNQTTPPPSRDIQARMKRHAHEEFNPYLSTYQAEIASMPLVRRTVMADHFAEVTKHGVASRRLKVR